MLNILLGHLLWGQVTTMHPFRGLPAWTCASERQHDCSYSCRAYDRHPPLQVQSHLRHPTLEVSFIICQLSESEKLSWTHLCILPIRRVVFFLSITLRGLSPSAAVVGFLWVKSALTTRITVEDSPSRNSASSSRLIASVTESSLKNTTRASPANEPSSRAYIFTLGSPSSSSSMTPHREKRSRISSTSASRGRPVT